MVSLGMIEKTINHIVKSGKNAIPNRYKIRRYFFNSFKPDKSKITTLHNLNTLKNYEKRIQKSERKAENLRKIAQNELTKKQKKEEGIKEHLKNLKRHEDRISRRKIHEDNAKINRERKRKREHGKEINKRNRERQELKKACLNKRKTIVIVDLPNFLNSIKYCKLNKATKKGKIYMLRNLILKINKQQFILILEKYILKYLDDAHCIIFFTTPNYKFYNNALNQYRKKKKLECMISIKKFSIPIINTRYFKDIDKQMIEYITHIASCGLNMEKFIIVTGDAHFYPSIWNIATQDIKIHIIAHEESLSEDYDNLDY